MMSLMPMPMQMTCADGKFRVRDSFTVAIAGQPHPRLYQAASRALRRLSGRTGLFFAQDYVTPASKVESARLVIYVDRPGEVKLQEDESYTLKVTAENIELKAGTDLGGLRGLETLLQILAADTDGYFFPAVEIVDSPRFPWRGLLCDVCRHFLPVEVLKRNLDAMAAVKLNVFHWHLTEDQGFRVESKIFPKLHQYGSDGLYYTQEQIRDIIAYADARGIRVMPEFDMPGHATSWFVGHPELASAPGNYTIERKFGVKDPTMDPTREETYLFLDAFLGEMAGLFPDAYMHIGGDENNGKMWNTNPAIQEFRKKHDLADNHALQAYFNQRILQILSKHGKKLVGWDEILHPDMPTNIVIQSWRGPKGLVQSAQRGYLGILSNGYYIDLIQPAAFHYLNDPIPANSTLKAEERQRILGGEATMWAELVTPENVDSRIWPRTAAIAERLWSPATVSDVADMYRRLEVISQQLEELGVTHIKNYEMMLRRLTRYTDITALKTLVDIVEPLKIYNRHRQRYMQGEFYTSYSPLTRVADTAMPESLKARHFNSLVEAFVAATPKAPEQAKAIEDTLVMWRDNHARLLPTIANAPVLQEIKTLSEDVSTLARIGLDALAYLRAGKTAESGWLQPKLEFLDKAKSPYAETEIMVVAGIEKLLQAIAPK